MSMSSNAQNVAGMLGEALRQLPEELRTEALTHVSYANERGRSQETNERLEFLGDAVLQLTCSHYLFVKYPKAPEGVLTRMRASVVSGQNLAAVAQEAGLGERLLLGKGEETEGGRGRVRILAGAFEAVLGAVYVHSGYAAASDLVQGLLMRPFEGEDREAPANVPIDPKTQVQEMVQKTQGGTVEYKVISVAGPPHLPVYTVACVVGGEEVSAGHGSSKKEAEEAAASAYLSLVSSV